MSDQVRDGTLEHNTSGLEKLVGYDRGSDLIAPLASIAKIADRVGELKVLSIGPRTEMEIFALIGLGFNPPNIDAVDLISYSPLVQVADMHSLPFCDDHFDVIIAGWVLAYSKNIKSAV